MDNHAVSARAHRIGVVICRQHSLASVGLVLDIFRMANEMPGRRRFALWRISQDGQPVPHADGLLTVDGDVSLLADMDAVLIPSLWAHGPEAVAEHPALVEALRRLPPRVLVAALCSGAYLLAASGRLDGRRATTHWLLAGGLKARYPAVDMDASQNLTQDEGIVCSGGSLAAVDGCFHVVGLLAGREAARGLARMMVSDVRRGPQTLYAPAQGWRAHGDREMRVVEQHIAGHHAQVLTLPELAALVHMSVRTLQRRFLAATGMTPIQYQQAVRVERGKDLLEAEHLPVQDVAARVGYEDRVAFGRLFKKMTGMTPAAWRQRHHGGPPV